MISILLTSYNREEYIAEAITSILASDFNDFELIIVDDCSTDKTYTIAESFAKEDSRIRLYRNSSNLGQFRNRNKAATYAKSALLMYVDSDDKIMPDAIRYLVTNFNLFPDAGYSTICRPKDFERPTILSSEEAIERHFFNGSLLHFGPGATAIKRQLFEQIGGFPDKYGVAGDMYYNVKAACNTQVLLLPYNYLFYRRHDGQEVNNRYSYLCDGYRYFQDLMLLPELPLSEEKRIYLRKKSKRRFVVNTIKHFLKSHKLDESVRAYKNVRFRLVDFFEAIFN